MKILVVDDVTDNSDLLSRLVQMHGHEPIVGSNGEQAVALTLEHQPDLIFMDMSMPVMSGYEATRIIRAKPEISHTPIVAFTAHAMAADKQACFDAGCNRVMTKPIDIAQLKETLEHFAAQKHPRSTPTEASE